MELGNLLSLIIDSAGLLGFIGTVYQVRKNSSSAQASTEVEQAAQESADWGTFSARIQGHMDFLEGQVQNLRSEVQGLRNDRTYDREHIKILQRQIWAQLPPPPMNPPTRSRMIKSADNKNNQTKPPCQGGFRI